MSDFHVHGYAWPESVLWSWAAGGSDVEKVMERLRSGTN